MNIKLFEIRDVGSFVPVMCIKFHATNESERYLLARSGYGSNVDDQSRYVLLFGLHDCKGGYSEYGHGGNRTRSVAHKYIIENWSALESGDLIDVEFILGEQKTKKESERTHNEH